MKLSQRAKIYVMSNLILTSFLIITHTKETRNRTWFPTHKAQHICSHYSPRTANKSDLIISLFSCLWSPIDCWGGLGAGGGITCDTRTEKCVQTSAAQLFAQDCKGIHILSFSQLILLSVSCSKNGNGETRWERVDFVKKQQEMMFSRLWNFEEIERTIKLMAQFSKTRISTSCGGLLTILTIRGLS